MEIRIILVVAIPAAAEIRPIKTRPKQIPLHVMQSVSRPLLSAFYILAVTTHSPI